MKKVAIIAGVLMMMTFGTNAFAQKIGYVSLQELMQQMPEAKTADTALQKYGKDLNDQITLLQQNYQTLITDFQQKQDSMSDAVKEVKTREITDAQKRISDFQQSAQERYNDKQTQLMQPIIDKAKKTISAVAKEKGYAYVIQKEVLLVMPDADDLMPAVKAKLGIK